MEIKLVKLVSANWGGLTWGRVGLGWMGGVVFEILVVGEEALAEGGVAGCTAFVVAAWRRMRFLSRIQQDVQRLLE